MFLPADANTLMALHLRYSDEPFEGTVRKCLGDRQGDGDVLRPIFSVVVSAGRVVNPVPVINLHNMFLVWRYIFCFLYYRLPQQRDQSDNLNKLRD